MMTSLITTNNTKAVDHANDLP